MFNPFFLYRAWQCPQQFLGLLLVKITGAEKRETGGIVWYWFNKDKNRFTRFISGVSLGRYILLPYNDINTVKHEHGHSIQSKYLGLFYLLIVGVYSAVFCNLWDRVFHKGWCRYDRAYWYYKTRRTESWADELGGVDRDDVLRKIPRPCNARYPAINDGGRE